MNTEDQCWANAKELIGLRIGLIALGVSGFLIRIAFWLGMGKPLNTVTLTGHVLTALALTLFVAHVSMYRPRNGWQYLVSFWVRSSLWAFSLVMLDIMRAKQVDFGSHLFTSMFYAALTVGGQWYKQWQKADAAN